VPRNFSPFVARQYWRKRWAPRDRFRAPSGGNGAFASGASRVSWINGNHLQMRRLRGRNFFRSLASELDVK
jgi:hypothetical protein